MKLDKVGLPEDTYWRKSGKKQGPKDSASWHRGPKKPDASEVSKIKKRSKGKDCRDCNYSRTDYKDRKRIIRCKKLPEDMNDFPYPGSSCENYDNH